MTSSNQYSKAEQNWDAPIVPVWNDDEQMKMGFDAKTEGLNFTQRRRLQERKYWKTYWEVRDKESQRSYVRRFHYHLAYVFFKPITFFRENIVEPLHDRFQLPYYHRKFDRVPEIDQCGVHDSVCIWEANEQYRIDKLVDGYIMNILLTRLGACTKFYGLARIHMCARQVEDFQENDLNFFIKYGEIGAQADVSDAYMKQKHRLIWERRHPEIMEERKRATEAHKKAMRAGKFDVAFWNKFAIYTNKYEVNPVKVFGPSWDQGKFPFEGDQPLSKDWRYYKKLSEDVSFDKRSYPKWLNEAAEKAKKWEEEQWALKNAAAVAVESS